MAHLITSLPTELISSIASELSDADLRSLHVTCTVLYKRSKYVFGNRFFTNVNVLLHPLSFEKISYIAKDKDYAQRVEKVAFSTHVLRCHQAAGTSESDILANLGPGLCVSRLEEEYTLERQRLCLAEEQFIEHHAAKELADVVIKLKALKQITVSDFAHSWDQDYIGRVKYTVPWGCRELSHRTSWNPVENPQCLRSRAWKLRGEVLETILLGMINTNLASRSVSLCLALHIDHRRAKQLDKLKAFDLQAWSNSIAPSFAEFTSAIDVDIPFNRMLLQSISPVGLSLNYLRKSNMIGPFNLYLGDYPRLERLHLSHVSTAASQITAFLEKRSSTLHSLQLANVYLWWTSLAQNHHLPAGFPWVSVWKAISNMNVLAELHLSNLGAAPGLLEPVPAHAALELSCSSKGEVEAAMKPLLDGYGDGNIAQLAPNILDHLWVDLRSAIDAVQLHQIWMEINAGQN